MLGALPDLAEKLALGHLNGLYANVAATYEHGTEVHICSDSLVCNGTSASFSSFLCITLALDRPTRSIWRDSLELWWGN